MNRKITLRELAAHISSTASIPEADAEAFIMEFASTITSGLADGDTVKVKEIGTFVTEGDTVLFSPDTALADAVNMPFAEFEPIELGEDITDEMLESASEPDITPDQQPTEEPAEEETPETNNPAPEPDTETETIEPVTEQESSTEETCDPSTSESGQSGPETYIAEFEPESAEPEIPEPQQRASHRVAWLLSIVACAVCFVAGYYVGKMQPNDTTPVESGNTTDAIEEFTGDPDTVDMAPVVPDTAFTTPEANGIPAISTPVPTVVTDTIRRDRFLTTMARQYYGRMEFWVYIYEENSSSLGNPDRISKGTVVVIPPAEKYGIDPKDAESISRAEMKSKEIYAPYKK